MITAYENELINGVQVVAPKSYRIEGFLSLWMILGLEWSQEGAT